MKLLTRLKEQKKTVCGLLGLLGFFMLSGVVPENPNAFTQGLAALAIIITAIVGGAWSANAE